MVESVQIQVREILTGQVADGQALARRIMGRIVVNYPFQQGEKPRILEQPAYPLFEYFVVRRVKILCHVSFEKPAVLPGKGPCPLYGPVAPLTLPAGIGIMDIAPLKYGFQYRADAVMNHAVPEQRRRDPSFLRLPDGEGMIRTRAVDGIQ